MKTAVVILNWNGEKFLRKFLPGLIASLQGCDAEVTVADNASTDGSMKLMLYDFPKVKTIRFDKNYGFTGGYNRALFQTDAEYFVLLNSDIDVPPARRVDGHASGVRYLRPEAALIPGQEHV